jgi:hypothetical protein
MKATGMTGSRGKVARCFMAGLAMALSVALAPSAGHAQGRDPAVADALFKAGRKAMEVGDYPSACAKFRESQRLDPAVGTLLNLADCEEKRGKIAEASALYRQVVDQLPPSDDRVPIAKTRIAALEPRVPRLTIRLAPGAPAGALVKRDGIELGPASLDLPLPMDPGGHVILVTAPGRLERSFDVTLAEGEARSIEVSPGAEHQPMRPPSAPPLPASPPPASPPPARSGSSAMRTTGFIVGGFGVVAVGVGTATGIMVLGAKSTAEEDCPPPRPCRTQNGRDAVERGRTLGPVTTVALSIGAAALAGATALILVSRNKSGATALEANAGVRGATLSLKRSW